MRVRIRRNTVGLWWLLATGLVCSDWLVGQSAAPDPAAGFQRVESGVEVVRQWRAEQHLYVKGNLGVPAAALNQLEDWLDRHATNWTVVLLEHAGQESYPDAAGPVFTGMDAVEHALGKGLTGQTGFGQLLDPRTQERNGAFFVLFLKERKFSYYGSDAQDRRGLGEDRWAGQLDRPAIAAMRGGGRIVDAVKDTITSINQQLDAHIAAEQQQRARREVEARAERARVQDQARTSLDNATNALRQLEGKWGTLIRDKPGLSGDLARPNLAGLRAEIQAAQSELAEGMAKEAMLRADSIRDRALQHIRAIEKYRTARAELTATSTAIEQLARQDRYRAAATDLQSARQQLAQSRQDYERGHSAYAAALDAAKKSVQSAENRIQASELVAARQRQLTKTAALLALSALGGLGFGLNRRRRPDKLEATQLATVWSQGLGDKTAALFDLLDRVAGVLGSSSQEAAQRYAGETLKLSQQIIQDVDELFLMSACAGRVLRGAQALIEPATVSGRLRNSFARRNYRTAIRQLRDEPIAFRPEEGLELVVRGPKTDRDTLLGHLEAYQPFAMSFNQLIDAFNQRASRALSNLELVEASIRTIGDTLISLNQRIQATQDQESSLLHASEPNGWFRLTSVFGQLLPAARRDQADAIAIGVRDAVGALRGPAARAGRQADDAQALTRIGLEFHQKIKPRLAETENQLQAAALRTAWIAAAVEAASQRADEITGQAVAQPAADDIQALQLQLQQLAERAAQATALDQVRRTTAQQSVDDAVVSLDQTRQELGVALNLGPEKLLREPGQDPSDRIVRAREQLAAVKASLERGDTAAAQNGLAAAKGLAQEVHQIITATRQAFSTSEATLAACRGETDRLAALLPQHEQILAQLQADYVPSVLRLGEGDPTHPDANGTVQDNLAEVRRLLEESRQLSEQAVRLLSTAQLLQSAGCLDQVKARQNLAVFRFQEIEDKQERVRQTVSHNRENLGNLERKAQELESTASDARTMAPTLHLLTDTRQKLSQANGLVEACPQDPFTLEALLAEAERQLACVTDKIRCDWDLFGEAERSVKAAANQLATAHRLAQEAAVDQAGDSPATVQAYHDLEQLTAALARARQALQAVHGDWSALDAEADGVANEAARVAATLQGELQAAQAAIAAITAAAAAVRTAGLWTGPFGVSIAGCPGTDLLTQARGALEQGSYADARQAAASAQSIADLAVAEAQAEVLRRQRAEAERQEQERRHRQQQEWHRRHSTPSWGHSGSGFGRSTFSSGSGVGHSSFSSGSGVGRSGW